MIKKILILAIGSVVGGHERQLLGIIQEIISMGCYVDVLCTSSNVAKYFEKNNVKSSNSIVYKPGKIWFQLYHSHDYSQMIKDSISDYKIVLISGGTIEACIGYSKAVRLLSKNTKTLAYIPMFIDRSITRQYLGFLYNQLVKFFVNNIDYIITINKIQARILRLAYRKKIFLINNYVNNDCIPPKLNGSKLVYCGRIDDKQKNIINLIDFLDSPSNPYKELLIIGDGPDIERVRKRAKDTASIKISIVGWLNNIEMPNFIGTNDLLILNSRWEGEPMVIREFAGMGIPCVAPNIAGFRSTVPRCMRFSSHAELLEVLIKYHGQLIPQPFLVRPSNDFQLSRRYKQVFNLLSFDFIDN